MPEHAFYASSAAALFLRRDEGIRMFFMRTCELGVFLLVRFLYTSKENEHARRCGNRQLLILNLNL